MLAGASTTNGSGRAQIPLPTVDQSEAGRAYSRSLSDDRGVTVCQGIATRRRRVLDHPEVVCARRDRLL